MVTFGGVIVMKFNIRDNFMHSSAGEIPYLPEVRLSYILHDQRSHLEFSGNCYADSVKCA